MRVRCALSRWRRAIQKATPVWRRWLVQKVVAMGMLWVWRKVLYCMEQMKLMVIWEI